MKLCLIFWVVSVTACYFSCSADDAVFTRNSIVSPPIDDISLYDNAKFCIIRNVLLKSPVNSIATLLNKNDAISEQEKLKILVQYSEQIRSVDESYAPAMIEYENKKGRGKATISQAMLYGVMKQNGIEAYIEKYDVFIPEITQDFDISLLSISIDNNIPAILNNHEKIYMCLGYDSNSLYVADMSKVTGFVNIPCLPRVERLRKEKTLSEFDQQWLEETEEKLKTGKVQAYYEDFFFNKNEATRVAPFISRIPIKSFSGGMTIFSIPKIKFNEII